MNDSSDVIKDAPETPESNLEKTESVAENEAPETPESGLDKPESTTEGEENDPQSLQGRIVELEKETSELRQQLQTTHDRYLRLAADFDNFRRRVQREKDDLISTAAEGVVLKLLPVLDNLQLALKTGKNTDLPEESASKAKDALQSGLELVERQFKAVLEAEGVTEVPGVGATFDPRYHEAVLQTEGEGEPGQILEVLRPGYMLGDKVLRAGMVRVAK